MKLSKKLIPMPLLFRLSLRFSTSTAYCCKQTHTQTQMVCLRWPTWKTTCSRWLHYSLQEVGQQKAAESQVTAANKTATNKIAARDSQNQSSQSTERNHPFFKTLDVQKKERKREAADKLALKNQKKANRLANEVQKLPNTFDQIPETTFINNALRNKY